MTRQEYIDMVVSATNYSGQRYVDYWAPIVCISCVAISNSVLLINVNDGVFTPMIDGELDRNRLTVFTRNFKVYNFGVQRMMVAKRKEPLR